MFLHPCHAPQLSALQPRILSRNRIYIVDIIKQHQNKTIYRNCSYACSTILRYCRYKQSLPAVSPPPQYEAKYKLLLIDCYICLFVNWWGRVVKQWILANWKSLNNLHNCCVQHSISNHDKFIFHNNPEYIKHFQII